MTHQYQLSGLTCNSCVATVKKALTQVNGIQSVTINESSDEATIEMTQHVSTDILKAALKDHPKYQIADKAVVVFQSTPAAFSQIDDEMDKRSWLETYKPILLIFGYITFVTFFAASDMMTWMRYFMAGFFLVFSFFKILNLSGFSDSYRMYDIVAKAIPSYGFVYPFIELGLGIAFLANFQPFATNIVTFIVMSVSIIGVLRSVLNKRKIQCACLGAVFNLPMSTVTIIEDALMIVMSASMIFMLN